MMPTKLTPRLLDEIVNLVRAGNPPAKAIAAKGINPGTERRWRQRAQERPGSIYGTYRARIEQAIAEASTIDVQVITNAATRGTRETVTTTVTKKEVRADGTLAVTDETTTTRITDKPGDWRASAFKLERRDPDWRPRQEVAAAVTHLPPDMLGRAMGELLRIAQGDEGPSLLRDDDIEARAIMPPEPAE